MPLVEFVGSDVHALGYRLGLLLRGVKDRAGGGGVAGGSARSRRGVGEAARRGQLRAERGVGDEAVADEVLVDRQVGDGVMDLSFNIVALPERVEGVGRGALSAAATVVS